MTFTIFHLQGCPRLSQPAFRSKATVSETLVAFPQSRFLRINLLMETLQNSNKLSLSAKTFMCLEEVDFEALLNKLNAHL